MVQGNELEVRTFGGGDAAVEGTHQRLPFRSGHFQKEVYNLIFLLFKFDEKKQEKRSRRGRKDETKPMAYSLVKWPLFLEGGETWRAACVRHAAFDWADISPGEVRSP